MSIQDRLMSDLKVALRERDDATKRAIRLALAALKNARVDKNADLTEEEEVLVLRKEVKQCRDSIAEYEKGGRDDLACEEAAEIEILEKYLPRALERDEVVELARQVIAQTGASGPRAMGQVMHELMLRVQGRADGRMVSEVVRQLLAG